MHGAFNFHLQFTADSNPVGVGDAVPNEGTRGVPVESAGVGDAGSDCCSDRTVTRNAGEVEVID